MLTWCYRVKRSDDVKELYFTVSKAVGFFSNLTKIILAIYCLQLFQYGNWNSNEFVSVRHLSLPLSLESWVKIKWDWEKLLEKVLPWWNWNWYLLLFINSPFYSVGPSCFKDDSVKSVYIMTRQQLHHIEYRARWYLIERLANSHQKTMSRR